MRQDISHVQCLIRVVRVRIIDTMKHHEIQTCGRLKDTDLACCDALVDSVHKIILNLVRVVWVMEVLSRALHFRQLYLPRALLYYVLECSITGDPTLTSLIEKMFYIVTRRMCC